MFLTAKAENNPTPQQPKPPETTIMNEKTRTSQSPAPNLDEISSVPAPSRSLESRPSSRSVGARMTVGPGINLKGEISDCDTLVVEGTIDATLVAEALTVSEGGIFSGVATVSEAEINGRFEGEITVTGALQVRNGGHVTGTIKYGRIEVESGGEISGLVTREEPSSPSTGAAAISAPRYKTLPAVD